MFSYVRSGWGSGPPLNPAACLEKSWVFQASGPTCAEHMARENTSGAPLPKPLQAPRTTTSPPPPPPSRTHSANWVRVPPSVKDVSPLVSHSSTAERERERERDPLCPSTSTKHVQHATVSHYSDRQAGLSDVAET